MEIKIGLGLAISAGVALETGGSIGHGFALILSIFSVSSFLEAGANSIIAQLKKMEKK